MSGGVISQMLRHAPLSTAFAPEGADDAFGPVPDADLQVRLRGDLRCARPGRDRRPLRRPHPLAGRQARGAEGAQPMRRARQGRAGRSGGRRGLLVGHFGPDGDRVASRARSRTRRLRYAAAKAGGATMHERGPTEEEQDGERGRRVGPAAGQPAHWPNRGWVGSMRDLGTWSIHERTSTSRSVSGNARIWRFTP